jgi:hypothetical protein
MLLLECCTTQFLTLQKRFDHILRMGLQAQLAYAAN